MAKIIFILLDGLGYATAKACMCHLQALVIAGKAGFLRMQAQLPPLSRPIYATLLTGLVPLEHGILTNADQRPLQAPTIFDLALEQGLVTAAAAYSWFLELSVDAAFAPQLRYWRDPASRIQHGIFYSQDCYPDAELFADAEFLRREYAPHLLLAHSMGIDYAGHLAGCNSLEYQKAVAQADQLLAQYCPKWLACGYDLLICSDHGMAANGLHYSLSPDVLNVPCWLVGPGWPKLERLAQTDIASLIGNQLLTGPSG